MDQTAFRTVLRLFLGSRQMLLMAQFRPEIIIIFLEHFIFRRMHQEPELILLPYTSCNRGIET